MMPDANFVLEQLDWHTLTCQCQITAHCPHRDQPCSNTATRQVEFHAIDQCNQNRIGGEGEVNAFGNYVFLLCETCLYVLAQSVAEHLVRLNVFGRKICMTCGAPVAQIDHIIREITQL